MSGQMGAAVKDSLGGVDTGVIGKGHGGDYADGFMSSVSRGIDLQSAIGDVDLGDTGRSAGRSFRDSIVPEIEKAGAESTRAMGVAGGGSGNAFVRGFKGSGFDAAADAAANKFAVLFATGNIVGGGLAALVSGLSSVVAGLFAMGAASASAAGAIGVLPGLIAAAAQGMIGLKVAFSGVGEAVKAGLKVAPAATAATTSAANAAAKAVESAQQRIIDAQRAAADATRSAQQRIIDAQRTATRAVMDAKNSLSGAYADAAQAAADAADRVARAERDVSDAQRDTLNAQRALTQARKDGAETLQQLGFDAEGAALAEERAGIRLQKARRDLVAAQALPAGNDAARQEAALAFKEAELNYRESKDRASDLRRENAAAAKAGVNGTRAVQTAQERIASAQQKQADTERALADARNKQAQTQVDNQNKIREAQLRVSRAQEDGARSVTSAQAALAQAQSDGARNVARAQADLADAYQRQAAAGQQASTSATAYATALGKLSPQAQAFVKYLISIQGALRDVKAAAGEELFPRLQTALEPIVATVFPLLEKQLRGTGRALGDAAIGISNVVTSSEGLKLIQSIMGRNNQIIEIGGKMFAGLALLVLRVLDAVGPLTVRFATFIQGLTDAAVKATDTKKEMQGVVDFFTRAGDTAALLGSIIRNVLGIVYQLGRSASESGQGLLVSFDGATQRLRDFLKVAADNGSLKEFFSTAADNLRIIGGLLGSIITGFLKIGGDKRTGEAFKIFQTAQPYVARIFESMQRTAPELAKLGVAVLRFFAAFTESDAVDSFFATLTFLANGLASILENDIVRGALAILAPIFGITKAFRLAKLGAQFFALVLKGTLQGVTRTIGKIGAIPAAFAAAAKRTRGTRFGALTGSPSGGAGGRKAAAGGVDNAAAGGAERLRLNLEKLSVQFGLTSGAKDRFILNLKQLAIQFGLTGAAATGGAAGGAGRAAARGAASSAAASAPARSASLSGVHGPGITVPITPKINNAAVTSELTRTGGLVGKLGGLFRTFGKVGSFALAGLGRAFSVLLGPIGLIASIAIPFLISGFKKLYSSNTEFKGFIDALVSKVQQFVSFITDTILPALASFGAFITGKLLAGLFKFGQFLVTQFGPFFAQIRDLIVNDVAPAFKQFGTQVTAAFAPVVATLQTQVLPIVQRVFGYIVDFAQRFLIPIVGTLLVGVFKALFYVIKGVFTGILLIIKDAITLIAFVFSKILLPLIKYVIIPLFKALLFVVITVMKGVALYVQTAFAIIRTVWNVVLKPIILAMVRQFRDFKNAVGVVMRGIAALVLGSFNSIKNVWYGVLRPVIAAIMNRFRDFRGLVGLAMRVIAAYVLGSFNNIKSVWGKVLRPVIAAIVGKFVGLKNTAGSLFSKISSGFSAAIDSFQRKWNKYGRPLVDSIKTKFNSIKASVTKAWNTIKDAPANGIRNLINNLNSWLVTPLNTLTSKFGLTVPRIPMPKGLADGGLVSGKGGSRDDKEIRALSPGEFVLNAKSTNSIGRQTAAYINRTGQLPVAGGAIGAQVGPMGIFNPIGKIVDFVKDSGTLAKDIAKRGVDKVIGSLADGFTQFLPKGNDFVSQLIRAIFEKFNAATKGWGSDRQQEVEEELAADSGGVALGGTPEPGKYGGTNFNSDQLKNAAIIAAVAAKYKVGERGAKIGLMTAMQESSLLNIHFGDRDSLGLFQQRASWGSAAHRTDPAWAAGAFFRALKKVRNWQGLGLGQAAQRVQISAFPGAYSRWADEAQAIIKALGKVSGVGRVGSPDELTSWKGHTFTRQFATVLRAAERQAGKAIRIFQGGFRPSTSYSGTSHRGDAIDMQVDSRLLLILRKLGVAIWDRTGMGNWVAHMHGVPAFRNVGKGLGSAIWQASQYLKGFNGLDSGSRVKAGPQVKYNGLKLARGGVISAKEGGVIAMIAEAGRNERVEPLDASGLSARDRALFKLAIESSHRDSGAVSVRVYIGERELTDIVRYEVNDSNDSLAQTLQSGRKRRY